MYEFSATVVHVVTGKKILADFDLGFHLTIRAVIEVDGLHVPDQEDASGWLAARKVAQRLLPPETPLRVTSKALTFAHGEYPCVRADIDYGPLHEPRSEEGSFRVAMLAAGVATEAHTRLATVSQ